MKEIFVYTHMGLGDHIVCKGLLNILSTESRVITYVKSPNMACARLLFADNPSISIVEVSGDTEARHLLTKEPKEGRLIVGHENLKQDRPFDQSFYGQLGLDVSAKWINFTLARDLDDERVVREREAPDEPFCFLHTRTLRGTSEDIKTNLPNVHLNKERDGKTLMMSWLTLANSSAKAYFTNSSFFHLINQLNLCQDRRVFLKSLTTIPSELPTLNGNWELA